MNKIEEMAKGILSDFFEGKESEGYICLRIKAIQDVCFCVLSKLDNFHKGEIEQKISNKLTELNK